MKTKKSYLKNILIGLGVSLFSTLLVCSTITPLNNYKEASAVSYNDDDFVITLSSYELNNYVWTNLDNTLTNLYDDADTSFMCENIYYYDNTSYLFDDIYVDTTIYFDIYYSLDDITKTIVFGNNNKFQYIIFNSNTLVSETDLFASNLVIYFYNYVYYFAIKEAVSKDIQFNIIGDISIPTGSNTLWNIIRDFYVHYIWGGHDSYLETYSSNIVGTFATDTDMSYSDIVTSAFSYIPTDILSYDDDIVFNYIGLGDWLSTTSTIVTLILLLIAVIMGLIWLFKVISGLLLLRH